MGAFSQLAKYDDTKIYGKACDSHQLQGEVDNNIKNTETDKNMTKILILISAKVSSHF